MALLMRKTINALKAFFEVRSPLIWKLCFIMAGVLMLSLTGCKSHSIGLLNPKGIVAEEERKLFFDSLALMLIVVLPVIVMSFTFVYHYQASHRVKDYKPNWSHSYFLESLWWGIPCVIIVILAFITWKKTHELDPYQIIAGQKKPPLIIEVIALPWKWLFIYPQQHIATINYLVVPVGQQVEYLITTDNVPMSAFFIPQLGSQIYAMAGMRTQLHLLAGEEGVYDGMNSQFNGDGFSDMHFPVYALTPENLEKWFTKIQQSPNHLTADSYIQLLTPTIGAKPAFFAAVEDGLFDNVISTYMNSSGASHPRLEAPKLPITITPKE
jgi:cytochrome o ubiquinol oxidase subunit 2